MNVLVIVASNIGSGAAPTLSRADRAAIHWGKTLAPNHCEVRFPARDQMAATHAIAAHATSAVWNEFASAACDLVLIGPGAIDEFGDELAGWIAQQADAELLFDVLQLEPGGANWRVICDAGRGARDRLLVVGPLVLVLSELVERPPYVSRYRLDQAARNLPRENPNRPAPNWRAVTPRPPRAVSKSDTHADDRTNAAFGIEAGSRDSTRRQVISDEPRVCAQVLLRYLVHHGFVDRSVATLAKSVGLPRIPHALGERGYSEANAEPLSTTLALAIQRSPRRQGDDERRLSRRPRPKSDNASANSPSAVSPLQRGPRRINSSLLAGRRGPFKLS